MKKFKVAMSADFFDATGAPVFPQFDLTPLSDNPDIDFTVLEPCDEIAPEQIADKDALILLLPKITAKSLSQAENFKMVARFGVGYDNVDVQACNDAGVALVITPDGVRRPVAVCIMALMLALTGNMMIEDEIARQGPEGWAQKTNYNGFGLVGRTLASIGIGNIGAEMFRMARPYDMKFLAHDPFADPAVAKELGIELVGLDEIFPRADVLAVNCPLNDETRGLVNAERLAMMKPTAYLINTARGPIVDQKALTEVLQARRIAGAGLDVLEQEPPDADDPILKLDNAIITPHALCWTDQLFEATGAADVKAVFDLMAGKAPVGIVNREIVDNPVWQAKVAG